jgi:hypothetical protein
MQSIDYHDQTKKNLARMARDLSISGWHAMRKDQLIRALTDQQVCTHQQHSQKSPSENGVMITATKGTDKDKASHAFNDPVVAEKLAMRPWHGRIQHQSRDRIIAVARDPYWIHVYWEIGAMTLQRAHDAMGQLWHGSKPMLRIMDVTSEETSSLSERHERDEAIQSEVNNWYINVKNPGRKYRIDLGFLTRRGTFYIIAKSNTVNMPAVSMSTSIEDDWTTAQEEIHRIQTRVNDPESQAVSNQLIELFEDRFHQPIQKSSLTKLPSNLLTLGEEALHFEIGAELVLFGSTNPSSRLSIQGEPVAIEPDGSFSVRLNLPDSRQIIPAVATSLDGSEEKTIILAIERNTKSLEPQTHDTNDF